MGHFIFDAEYMLAEKELYPQSYQGIILYYYHKIVANSQWDKMVRRHFKIYDISRHLAWANGKIPFGRFHYKPSVAERFATADGNGVLEKTKPHIAFTEDEDAKGRDFLRSLGMKESDRYICFNIRDEAYMKIHYGSVSQFNENIPEYHWCRNSDIALYYKTMQALIDKGYWVIRMGKETEKEIGIKSQKIIDYPKSNFKSDFLDMWLGAHCHFMVTTGSGIDTLCHAYRKPEVCVSLIPISIVAYMHCGSINIFKHLKFKNGRRLTFAEISATGAWEFGNSKVFFDHGMEWEDNTPQEIYDAVFEMVARLDGAWVDKKEDEILHEKIWQILLKSPSYSRFYKVPKHRIGTQYLRDHRELLNA